MSRALRHARGVARAVGATLLCVGAATGCTAVSGADKARPTVTVTTGIPSPTTIVETARTTVRVTQRLTTAVTVMVTPATTVTRTQTPTVDIAGPTAGPPCPGAPGYADEPAAGLDAAAADAWALAVIRAGSEGVTLCLNDGKRSRTQQQEIYDDYLRRYGAQTADELVLPPDLSSHVTGFALDVQPAAAYRWLESTAGSLGFCRIYDNEPWHFEYRSEYQARGCPDRLPEPIR